MKIKKGDKVQVITGQNKGKTAEVLAAFPKLNKVTVEGVNIRRRHTKPSQVNPDGGMVEKECPIHVSNVKLAEKKSAKKTTAKKAAPKKAAKKEEGGKN